MSSKWEKKYAGVPKGLIEELAELRHNQMRSWSEKFINLIVKFKEEGKTLKDLEDEMWKLCGNNSIDYKFLSDVYKGQSRVFAFAVIDIVRKYNKEPV